MAYIAPIGDSFKAQISRRDSTGKRVRLNQTFGTRREAEIWAADTESKILHGKKGYHDS